MTILGVYVNPTTSSGGRVIACNATTGRPHFQSIEIPQPDTGKGWQVTKLGVCLRENKAAEGVRLALYEDSGSETLTSTCALLAEGEITTSTPSTDAFLDVSVTPVNLDPNETVFWLGVKGVGADSSEYDTINFFTSLQDDALKSYHLYNVCSSIAPSGTAWPDPWGYSSPTVAFTNYCLHLWMEADQIDLPAIISEQTFPLFLLDGAATALPQDRAWIDFPSFALAAEGTSVLDFVSITNERPVSYTATLTASGLSDYTLSISALNLRLRKSPGFCFLQLSIPDILMHFDEINARLAGTVTVYQTTTAGTTALITADVDSLQSFVGATQRSGILRAQRQVGFSTPQLLGGIVPSRYVYSGGRIRYRCKPHAVYPGDALQIRGSIAIVSEVQLDVNESGRVMEIIVG